MKTIGVIQQISDTEIKFIGYGEFFEKPIWEGHELYEEMFDMGLSIPMIKFSDGSVESIMDYQWASVDSINTRLLKYIDRNFKIYYPSTNRMVIPSI